MMNRRLMALLTSDLLQSSRQSQAVSGGTLTARYSRRSIYFWLILQNIVMAALFGFMYSWLFVRIPLPSFPGLYTHYFLMMGSFVLLQLFYQLFSVFFDSQELNQYLALPFSLMELFLSKIFSIVLSVVGMMVPIMVLVMILGHQTGHSLLWVIPVGILIGLFLLGLIIALEMIIFAALAQTKFFQRHRRVVGAGLYFMSVVVMVLIVLKNSAFEPVSGAIPDRQVITIFRPFYDLFIPGQMMNALLGLLVWLVVFSVSWWLVLRWVVPRLYGQGSENTQITQKAKKNTAALHDRPSFNKWFMRYQMRQMGDTGLIMQIFFSKFYMPIIMFMPMLLDSERMSLKELDFGKASGLFLLYGFAFSIITISNASISGISISLDRQNFNYFKTLPFSFKNYLAKKLFFVSILEWLPGFVMLLGAGLYTQINVLALGLVVSGYTLGILAQAYYYFIQDFRHLNLNWTNIQELSRRGMHRGLRVFLFLVIMLAGSFGLVMLTFYVLSRPEWLQLLISGLIVVGLGALLVIIYLYGQKNLWQKISE